MRDFNYLCFGFTTKPITVPDITTGLVTNITQKTAECGVNITSNGGAKVTAHGIC